MNHTANINWIVNPVQHPFNPDENLDRLAEAPIITPAPEPVVLKVTDITGHAYSTLKRPNCATMACWVCPFYKERGQC